jgi:hypothetical protein
MLHQVIKKVRLLVEDGEIPDKSPTDNSSDKTGRR